MSTILRLTLILSTILSATNAYAFNKERCGTLFPKSDDTHPPYYGPLYVVTMIPSTTSYLLSIGPCSMYGNTGARISFIEKSLDSLQVDAARGQGEYLDALAQLSGCSNAQYAAFGSAMQSHFATVFASGNSAQMISRIDSVMNADERLSRTCATVN